MKTNTTFLISCINTHTQTHVVCILYPLQIIPLTFHFCWLPSTDVTKVALSAWHHTVNILKGILCFWWKLHFDRVSEKMLCLFCQMCCLPTAPSGRPSRRLWVVWERDPLSYADCVSRDDAGDKILLRDSSWPEIHYSILSLLLQTGISFTAQ